MKVKMINPSGAIWEFDSAAKAKPFINPDRYDEYDVIVEEDGEKIRVYDDRELPPECR